MTISDFPQSIQNGNRPYFDQVEGTHPAEGKLNTGDARRRTTNKGYWSPGQLAVLQNAIRNAKGQPVLTNDTVRLVNRLAEEGEGVHHIRAACRSKISRLIFKDKLIRAIDPSGTMSDTEIERQKRKPVVGEDLEKLREMRNRNIPAGDIAIALKRDHSVIKTAIRKMKAPGAGDEARRTVHRPPADPEVLAMEDPQSKAILFNDHEILPSGYNPITSSEPEGPGKRKIVPEAGGSQAKRAKAAVKIQGQPWSANQLKVLREALEKANYSAIENYVPILDRVNALAAKGDGGLHTMKACFNQVNKLRLDGKIRYAIDPAGTMGEKEIASQMNKPVEGDEIDYLIKLHKESTPMQDMAVLLKRTPYRIQSAIKQLKSPLNPIKQ